MPDPHQHSDRVNRLLQFQRGQVGDRPEIRDYDVGLSVPQERALERVQHANTLLEKSPPGHPYRTTRVQRAIRAVDRFLELT